MAVTNFDIDLLRAFLTVYEEGSFTRASEKLFRTQSAVSLQIRRLEELVGRQLIERDARKLRLTVYGQELQRYAKLMVRLNDRAIQRITAADGRRMITIGIPDDYVPTTMPLLTKIIEEYFPGSPVAIVCNVSPRLRSMFDAGELDIVIVTEREEADGDHGILVDELHWVKAPHLPVNLSEPLPLAFFPDGCLFRQEGIAALRAAQRDFRIVKSSLNFLVLKGALFEGAICVLAKHSITDDLEIISSELPRLPRIRVAFYSRLPYAAEFQRWLSGQWAQERKSIHAFDRTGYIAAEKTHKAAETL